MRDKIEYVTHLPIVISELSAQLQNISIMNTTDKCFDIPQNSLDKSSLFSALLCPLPTVHHRQYPHQLCLDFLGSLRFQICLLQN